MYPQAYDTSERAESLVIKRQYKDASKLYKQASDLFSKHIGTTSNKEINNALKILTEDHNKRSQELSSLENLKPPTKKVTNNSGTGGSSIGSGLHNLGVGNNNNNSTGMQSAYNKISTSLALARGIPGPSLDNLMGSVEDIDGHNGDPLQKLTVQLLNIFKPPKLNSFIEHNEIQVKPSGKSVEELDHENFHLKQLISNYAENLQIYESSNKKITRNVQTCLNNFKKEFTGKETRRIVELERKVDQLQKDNKDLSVQKEKLKQRWDELVESAKKRREESGANSAGTVKDSK